MIDRFKNLFVSWIRLQDKYKTYNLKTIVDATFQYLDLDSADSNSLKETVISINNFMASSQYKSLLEAPSF